MTMQSENRGTGLSNNLRAPPQLDVLRPADELVGLRRFLERLDSAQTTLSRSQVDVTESEISILKHEIACLERVFAKIRSGGLYS